MPIEPIIDPAVYDPAAIEIPLTEIRQVNQQRGTFEQLDGILRVDLDQKIAVGVRHVRKDAFWVPDHVPGRPLLPGVLMLESLAQLCSYYYHRAWQEGEGGRFFGWGGLEEVSFRGAVLPGETMLLAVRNEELRARRARFLTQAFVGSKCVIEATIIGMPIQDPRWAAGAKKA